MSRSAAPVVIPFVAGPVAADGGLRDQIYKACLAAIVEGRLCRGARLPSARQLAAEGRRLGSVTVQRWARTSGALLTTSGADVP